MKSKVRSFVSSFVLYCVILLGWNNWQLTNKDVAEMIFIGTLCSLTLALTEKHMTRLITRIVEKVVTK